MLHGFLGWPFMRCSSATLIDSILTRIRGPFEVLKSSSKLEEIDECMQTWVVSGRESCFPLACSLTGIFNNRL